MAKAKFIISSAENEFTREQIVFIRRMLFVLQDHHKLSASVKISEKKVQTLKIKRA